jgi:hypothetical protein
MRKIAVRKSKKATTLAELIIAMALMSVFLLACTSLILPITTIYTHMNEQSRAHLVADTVVDALRAECARTYITSQNDVWISQESGDALMDSIPGSTTEPGPVLVIRKSYEYCETLSSNYAITGDLCNAIYDAEKAEEVDPQTGNLTSRAIYKMFDTIPASSGDIVSPTGYLHYGYFKIGADSTNGNFPSELYDFTDPFLAPTYGNYSVILSFHDLKPDSTENIPVYVLVDVHISDGTEIVYTRSDVVLCFASRALD